MKKLATVVMVVVLGCFVFASVGCEKEEEGPVVPVPAPPAELPAS